jgi:predicted NAD/FAD-binding protein
LTYYLNRLQRLDAERDYCVTLNEDVPEEHVLARIAYTHPLYTVGTLAAQESLRRLSGKRNTLYAGAHLGNGFHEDGLPSTVAAAAALGVRW